MDLTSLVIALRAASRQYYLTGSSNLTDEQYDARLRYLRMVDPTNPYLLEIGTKVDDTESSKKVYHYIPMGTLSKCHKDQEVKSWIDSLPERSGTRILVAPKYDGFAVELVYRYGDLVAASTRGDSEIGEDIFETVKKIPSVPHRLHHYPTNVIVRGEVLAFADKFETLRSLGYTAMRNAVPGIVRSGNDAVQYLTFVAHGFYPMDDSEERPTRSSLRESFSDDFHVEDYEIFDKTDFEGISDYYSRMEVLRTSDSCPFEFDGIVLKSEISDEKVLDLYHPLHSISWKFKSKREATTLRGVEFQMGVTGKFSPIAVFDPVEFQGATLTKASLGSIDRMSKMITEEGLKIGCVIEVTRRGDIIPYVESVVMTDDVMCTPIDIPTNCPHCGRMLIGDPKDLICENPFCDEKVIMRISQYVAGVKVRGFGRALVESLVSNHHVLSIRDLYTICVDDCDDLTPNMKKMVKELQSRKMTSYQFLSTYPFDNIGASSWKSLESVGITINELYASNDVDTLVTTSGARGLSGQKGHALAAQYKLHREELNDIYQIVGSK